jgi:hypothetical protein
MGTMSRRKWKGTLGCVAGALVFASLSCAGMDSADPQDGTASGDQVQTVESALRRRRPPPPPPSTGGSSGSGSSLDAIIKAAQTPDGQAIPQAAGPNGLCPPVVQALGFWSCPTIGQTCSFASGGTTRHCTCSRTDGEGQFPSWICN